MKFKCVYGYDEKKFEFIRKIKIFAEDFLNFNSFISYQ